LIASSWRCLESHRSGLRHQPVRMMAGAGQEVHDWLSKPFEPVEYDIPAAATASGKLELTWTPEAGAGGQAAGVRCARYGSSNLREDAVRKSKSLADPSRRLRGSNRPRSRKPMFRGAAGLTQAWDRYVERVIQVVTRAKAA
jgi:hypothetical protein